jgi:ABC-type branched-subunit amino acid transport system substrate-binding protein
MYAGFGTGGDFGMEAAVEDINKQGGVYVEEYDCKLPIELLTVNCESDAVKVGLLAEDLILSDKVDILAGPIIPPPMNSPVALVAERNKVPFIGGTGPMEPWLGMRMEVTPPWEYSWMTGFRIATPAPPEDFRSVPGYTIMDIGLEILDEFGDDTNKIAGVFASDDSDGIGWYTHFPPELEKKGYNVIGEEKKLGLFPMNTTDFTPIITEWIDNDVQILWGNCPAPPFNTMWRQCQQMNFKPRMVYAARAALFWIDVDAFGGDLPWGVGCESWWDPSYEGCPGFGDTTPQSLYERWVEKTKEPLNPNIGWGYMAIQVVVDAIERAGTLDGAEINKALAKTDLMTICHRVKYDENQFSAQPIFYFQWVKTDNPWVWEPVIVVSQHDFIPTTGEPIWPMPYELYE